MSGRISTHVALLFLVTCALVSCDKATEPVAPIRPTKTVVVATLVSHPALDQIVSSLKEEMSRLGHVEGKDVRYVIKNANGDQKLVATIANEVTAASPDAVVAITTPMSQAIAKAHKGVFLFSAVTDPVGAGLVPSLDKPGAHISGVSDAWPYREQMELLREIAPGVRRVGVIHNPGDAASQYGMKQIRDIAASMGLKIEDASISAPGDVATVSEALIDRCDALYLSSDATAISGFAGAMKVCFRTKKPLMAGDSGTVEKGALAAVSVGYAGVGRETGKLLHKMLAGERNLPVVVAKGDEIYLNSKAADLSGVKIPDSVVNRAKRVFKTIP